MHAETHRIRLFLISVLLSLLALVLLARPAHSRWGAAPARLPATGAPSSLVAINAETQERGLLRAMPPVDAR